MSKKVQNSKSKKQFKLGDEIIDGTDTLYGALQKKFGIDKDQAQYIQPFVSNSSVHLPGQIPYSKFRQPVDNPDIFFKPTIEEPKDISYAVVDAVKRANDIYAPVGGFDAVMAAKRKDKSWKENEKYAKDIYSAAGKTTNSAIKPYTELVEPYNKFMSNKKNRLNIPVIHKNANDSSVGEYSPDDKVVSISKNLPYSKYEEFPQGLGYSTDTLTHELTHGVQEKVSPKSDKRYGETDNYYSEPIEMHARASALNQEYMKRTGKPLTNDKMIDEYLDSWLANREAITKLRKAYVDTYKQAEVPPRNYRMDDRMNQSKEYQALSNGIPYSEYSSLEDMLNSALPNLDKFIKAPKGQRQPEIKKYLKALIMTTAKNNEQIPQQPNGVFDNGFNIS